MFEVIPAVDIKDGACVQLVGGDPTKKIISLNDPFEVAKRWVEKGAKVLHVIDLDGAIGGERRNSKVIEKILELPVKVQLGGGIRRKEDASDLLRRVERIIIGTAAIKEPNIVKSLVEEFGGERIIVSLDSGGGKVLLNGWKTRSDFKPEELAKKFEEFGVERFLYTNVDVEGKMRGIDPAPIEKILNTIKIIANRRFVSTSLIVAGGISSISEILYLKKLGVDGVILGSALYKGKIALEDALDMGE